MKGMKEPQREIFIQKEKRAFQSLQLPALTYGTLCSNGNGLQKSLNNPRTDSREIAFAGIKVSQDFLYHVMRVLCL